MISWRHVTQWTRYVPHERAEDYCRLGWCIADAAASAAASYERQAAKLITLLQSAPIVGAAT